MKLYADQVKIVFDFLSDGNTHTFRDILRAIALKSDPSEKISYNAEANLILNRAHRAMLIEYQSNRIQFDDGSHKTQAEYRLISGVSWDTFANATSPWLQPSSRK